MEPFSLNRLHEIASLRNIDYQAIEHRDPLVVSTRMARRFPIPQDTVFRSFADPVSHVGLFSIIVGSTPPIRQGIEGLIGENQFFAFEHVQESSLPPRLMLLKYTLEPPFRITKEGVTDPFMAEDAQAMDRKKAMVTMQFEKVTEEETNIVAESTFHATTGAVFARGFIDRVWLNFFERMMVANGQIAETEMLA